MKFEIFVLGLRISNFEILGFKISNFTKFQILHKNRKILQKSLESRRGYVSHLSFHYRPDFSIKNLKK